MKEMILRLVIGIEDATQEGGNPELWEKHSKKIAQKKTSSEIKLSPHKTQGAVK